MPLNRLATAIVVDRASLARNLLTDQMRDYCDRVLAFSTVSELRAHLCVEMASLVVIDLATEGAMTWLEETSRLAQRPAVVVVTHLPSRDEEIHATLLGAIGYLTKPVTFDQLAVALAPARA